MAAQVSHPRIRAFRGNLIVKASFHEARARRQLLEELRANNVTFPSPWSPLSPPGVGLPPGGEGPTTDPTPLPMPTPGAGGPGEDKIGGAGESIVVFEPSCRTGL